MHANGTVYLVGAGPGAPDLLTPRVGEGESAREWARGFGAADAGTIYLGVGQAEAVAAGPVARLEFAIEETAAHSISVEMARERNRELALEPGDVAYLKLIRRIRFAAAA